MGFEPTRGDPTGLAGRRLKRSARVPYLDNRNSIASCLLCGDHFGCLKPGHSSLLGGDGRGHPSSTPREKCVVARHAARRHFCVRPTTSAATRAASHAIRLDGGAGARHNGQTIGGKRSIIGGRCTAHGQRVLCADGRARAIVA